MKNIKGRHWVFIIGFLAVFLTSFVSPDVADDMLDLMIIMGIGIFLRGK